MALQIRPDLSPRLITVLSPTTSISMQELIDDVRDWEDRPENLAYPYIIDASGKEELGGGVTVGISVTLQNAQLSFEARTTPTSSGTITTASASGLTVIDTGATFVSDGVTAGATINNHTTGASGTVLVVNGQQQLTLQQLAGGSRSDWQIGDVYDVHNIVQCNIVGGNLVAVDSIGDNLDPVFPTAHNQVVRTSSSSATLQELADLQHASFNGGVWLDVASGTTGIEFPRGTERQPVNNLTDAKIIANDRGFNTIYVIGNATISTVDMTDFVFIGQGQNISTINIDTSANVLNCTFKDAFITGTLDGKSRLLNCQIENINVVSGIIESCILMPGIIVLGGGETAHFIHCESGVPGETTPTIDCGGSGQSFALRGYNGGVRVINKTGSEAISIDLVSGQVRLDLATVTNGQIVIRGSGKVVNHANGDLMTTGAYGSLNILNETIFGVHLSDLWQWSGLDANNPMTVTPSQRSAGNITANITGDGETTSTVTRQ